MNQITINFYVTKTGKSPFADWHDDLDVKARAIIRTRLDRVRLGNLGDCKPIKSGDGIWEMRINYGPGFRIYFGKYGSKLVVLLVGGDKGSQKRDIEKAKHYWIECRDLLHD